MACIMFKSILFFHALSCVYASEVNDLISNGDLEFIDLSYSFNEQTIYWPNAKQFEFTKKDEYFQSDGSWYAGNDFAAGEHGGTHIDAPYHFNADGLTVDEIPVENLIVPLIIADVSSIVNDNANFILHKSHLDHMINYNMGKPCLIIFKFGWSKHVKDRKKYLGINKNNTLNFPGVSNEVVEWITSSYKNIVGIGVDVASLDPGSSTDLIAHKTIARAGRYIIENVKLDRPVPEHGCTGIALPMKITRGSGSPLRLVAVCPKEHNHFK